MNQIIMSATPRQDIDSSGVLGSVVNDTEGAFGADYMFDSYLLGLRDGELDPRTNEKGS